LRQGAPSWLKFRQQLVLGQVRFLKLVPFVRRHRRAHDLAAHDGVRCGHWAPVSPDIIIARNSGPPDTSGLGEVTGWPRAMDRAPVVTGRRSRPRRHSTRSVPLPRQSWLSCPWPISGSSGRSRPGLSSLACDRASTDFVGPRRATPAIRAYPVRAKMVWKNFPRNPFQPVQEAAPFGVSI
jgi:hypothetical protein